MDTPNPIRSNPGHSVAEHEKPQVLVTSQSLATGRLDRLMGWIRRPTIARMPMWKLLLLSVLGVPATLFIFLVIYFIIFPEPKREPISVSMPRSDWTAIPEQAVTVAPPGPWLEPLAQYLHVGPKRKASECYNETDHRQCNPSFPGLSLAGISFLNGNKDAWSVVLNVDDSSDFRPGRFGQLRQLCDRPGRMGFGATYYQVIGGPLIGNYVMIQRSAENPHGHQAFIKSPPYFRFAPSKFVAPDWERCTKDAGIPLRFNPSLD